MSWLHHHHNDFETQFNAEWEGKSDHRHMYGEYLAECRISRFKKNKTKFVGNDGVKVDLEIFSKNPQISVIDYESGLVPPEPTEFLNYINEHAKNASENEVKLASIPWDKKLRMLFQTLQEPVVQNVRLKAPPGTANVNSADATLTAVDLSNIFASKSSIDLGEVTVHSENKFPLNFLNATPNKVPIHISMLPSEFDVTECKNIKISGNSDKSLSVFPKHQVISTLQISGFELTFRCDIQGTYEKNIIYLVNGRYKYRIPVKVKVSPVSLSISCTEVKLESTVFPESANSKDQIINQQDKHISKAEQIFTITNFGNYPARFFCKISSKGSTVQVSNFSAEGNFTLDPSGGCVLPGTCVPLRIIFTPGLKPIFEEVFEILTIDDFDTLNIQVSQSNFVKCIGTVQPANCILLTSIKQGPLDLGAIGINYPNFLEENFTNFFLDDNDNDSHRLDYLFNVFAAPELMPISNINNQLTETTKQYGRRSIKIKNQSTNSCFFTAHLQSSNSEIVLEITSGIIPGSGILELPVKVVATKIGIFEDIVVVSIAGAGRLIKIPVKYESRAPEVEVKKGISDLETPTMVGSTNFSEFILKNYGSVTSRVLMDLRARNEFGIKIKSIELFERTKNSKPPMLMRSKNEKKEISINSEAINDNPISNRMCVISEDHKLFDFDGTIQSRRIKPNSRKLGKILKGIVKSLNSQQSSNNIDGVTLSTNASYMSIEDQDKNQKNLIIPSYSKEKKYGNIYLIEIKPGEIFTLSIIFSPKIVKKIFFDFPVRVLGSTAFSTFPITAEGILSSIQISRTFICFKNKVVFRDTGNGVSHLSGTLKETFTMSNTSQNSVQWLYDLSSLEEKDHVFRIEPSKGRIPPCESQIITISFQPESVGKYEASIPVHLEFSEKPQFNINIQGSGVEPSLVFDPPEIFLPIIPIGFECSTSFVIVNYGCERTEIKYSYENHFMDRYGSIELMFPEGKLLKSDGEKLPVHVKFTGKNQDSEAKTNSKGKSPGSISFTLKFEFMDSGKHLFSLPIHGTVDNSLLTLQPFINASKNDFDFQFKDGLITNPIIFTRITEIETSLNKK
ncbi:Cilia- and flagella-associated protein 47, partial [Nowakowskiella sp. JEL0078]